MKKILFLITLLISGISYGQNGGVNADFLTGDEKTACEVILCLSTSTRPNECSRPIAEYFGIKGFTKGVYDPVKTIKKRLNFLKLCPTDSDDTNLASLLDAQSKQEIQCTPEELNKRVETKGVRWGSYKDGGVDYFYRTNSQMPSYCKILFDHGYTDYTQKPVYRCDGKFYSEESWKSGQYKEEISYKKYRELKTQGQNVVKQGDKYYRLGLVEKDCWKWG